MEFTIEAQEIPKDGCVATYKLKRTAGEDVTYVGDAINIPKDAVLNGGTYEIVETADTPYAGAEVGEPYVDLVVANAYENHIYIPMKGLVDTTGATSVEVIGDGNAVTAASYDPATRKLILTADTTYATADYVDAQIAAKINELRLELEALRRDAICISQEDTESETEESET